jgi:hypothetical protein
MSFEGRDGSGQRWSLADDDPAANSPVERHAADHAPERAAPSSALLRCDIAAGSWRLNAYFTAPRYLSKRRRTWAASHERGPMFILSSKYEKSFWPRLVAPLIAGLLFSGAYHANAQAAPSATYIVSDQDGYGVMECLTQKSDCGKMVADAWCESHGHGAAKSYGRAEDITASIAADAPRQPLRPDAAIVSCAN